MATLTVTATQNYTGQTLTNIDTILFSTSAIATATFGSNQFGVGLISNSILITGDSFENQFQVNMSASGVFSAANWTFGNWNSAVDDILLNGTSGADTITGSSVTDFINGGGGADSLSGGGEADYIRGMAGNDTIDGGTGNDEARYDRDAAGGGAAGVNVNLATGTATDGFGNTDTLISIELVRGTNSADTLTGGNAANFAYEGYRGLGGNDTISGGNGFDEVFYNLDEDNGGGAGVTINLQAGTAVDGFGNTDTLVNIEGVRTTRFVDSITGSNFIGFFGDTLAGLAGNDTITGGLGFDDARYDLDDNYGGLAGVTVNLATGTAIDGFGNTDTLIGIENVRGTNQADTMIGNAFFNSFRGLGGNDTLNGGDGNDSVIYDQDANNGGTAGGVTVNLASGTATDGFGNTDTLISIENARGSEFADMLIGSAVDNYLMGLAGNDTLNGGSGGMDEARYDVDWFRGGSGGIVVNLASGTATDGFGNTDTLIGIDGIRGGRFNDGITGSSADEFFRGMAGNDTINGGGGIDTVRYDLDIYGRETGEAFAGVTVNLTTGIATDSFGNIDTLSGIEDVVGGLLADTLTGDGNANLFRGLAGNDTINGAGGLDTVDYSQDASAAELLFTTANAGVVVNLATGTATDGYANTDTLLGIENATGTAFADTITGDILANVLQGLDGNDTLDGGDGADTLRGGAGADSIIGGLGNDVIGAGDGNDSVYGGDGTDTLYGDAGTDVVEGGNGDDTLRGGLGNDTLRGGADNDWLDGQDGNDVIGAGDGNDLVYGLEGTDTLYGDGGNDVVEGGNGNDTMRGGLGADTLRGGADNDWLDGQDGNDVIGGGDGIDLVYGGEGDDTLYGDGGNDTVEGGNGNDTMRGGLGNDLVRGDAGSDVLYGQDGNDVLGGKDGNDQLFGGNDSDTLYGDGGMDTVNGGAGNDILRGGLDVDTFVFEAGWGSDQVMDWQNGVDRLDFTALAASGVHSAADLVITVESGNTVVRHGGQEIFLVGLASGVDTSNWLFA